MFVNRESREVSSKSQKGRAKLLDINLGSCLPLRLGFIVQGSVCHPLFHGYVKVWLRFHDVASSAEMESVTIISTFSNQTPHIHIVISYTNPNLRFHCPLTSWHGQVIGIASRIHQRGSCVSWSLIACNASTSFNCCSSGPALTDEAGGTASADGMAPSSN